MFLVAYYSEITTYNFHLRLHRFQYLLESKDLAIYRVNHPIYRCSCSSRCLLHKLVTSLYRKNVFIATSYKMNLQIFLLSYCAGICRANWISRADMDWRAAKYLFQTSRVWEDVSQDTTCRTTSRNISFTSVGKVLQSLLDEIEKLCQSTLRVLQNVEVKRTSHGYLSGSITPYFLCQTLSRPKKKFIDKK